MPRKQAQAETPEKPNPVGRPTDYKPTYPIEAKKLCALGLTDVEIAQFFEVNPLTIYRWKHEYPKFCKAMQRGKKLADDVVEKSLYKRATGFAQESVKIFMPAGASEPVYADFVEKFPPDTQAARLWLINRRPEKWRDRTSTEHSGTVSLSLGALVEESLKKK